MCSFVQDMSISAFLKSLAAPSSARPLDGHAGTRFVSLLVYKDLFCRPLSSESSVAFIVDDSVVQLVARHQSVITLPHGLYYSRNTPY
jgi:hypothetical protein